MRTSLLAFAVAIAFSFHAQAAQPAQAAAASAEYGKLPLSFEANRGQAAPEVKFISRGYGCSLFLTGSEAVLALTEGAAKTEPGNPKLSKAKTSVVRMSVVGANPSAQAVGTQDLPGVANYFIGNDPAKWKSNIPTYAKVRYNSVYPGIDLVYYGNQRQLEYDFIVAPKANPSAIQLHLSGATRLKLTPEGGLTVRTPTGEIAFDKPEIYQEIDGRRQSVQGRFTLLGHHSVGFALGGYNHRAPLVIDPVLVYSTYLGGSAGDSGNALALDASGNTYIAGITNSTDFPVTNGAYQLKNKTGRDGTAFVTKLNPAGTALVYSTYLGGSIYDYASGIAVDNTGNAFVTGYTQSSDFPVTKGAFQTTNLAVKSGNGGNSFAAKLNPSGGSLLYSTYLGGSFDDQAAGIATNSSGDAYITGQTLSSDFPVTPGALQTTFKGQNEFSAFNSDNVSLPNAFVTRLNADGTGLVYSTYLGGSGQLNELDNGLPGGSYGDSGSAIAVDESGNAYVAGSAYSTDFPTIKGSFQTANAGAINLANNAFVAKLNPTGSALVYSTYLGGSGELFFFDTINWGEGEGANGIAIDASGDVYVAGFSYSSDFPVTVDAYQKTNNAVANLAYDAFVSKLNPSGSALLYSTLLGGTGAQGMETQGGMFFPGSGEYPRNLSVDPSGAVSIAGDTASSDFPTTAGALYHCGGGFVSALNPSLSILTYSTYFPASPTSAAGNNDGNIYLTGFAGEGLPVTAGAFQAENRASATGGVNAFVSKLNLDTPKSPSETISTLTSSANSVVFGSSVTFTAHVVDSLGCASSPSGSVEFSVDSKQTAAVTLTLGKATYSTASLAIGKHTITASYAGNPTWAASSASLVETIVALPQTAPPTFSPKPGVTDTEQTVTLTDSTKDAVIYYTVSQYGTKPTTASTKYTVPIKIPQSRTIEAIAVAPGHSQSITVSGLFAIQADRPAFAPWGGVYPPNLPFEITDATPNATIYYTTDGTAPTGKSTKYTGTIRISKSETIQAIAVVRGIWNSKPTIATYTIEPSAPAPTFSPAAGKYTSAQTVKLADKATAGLEIYYTTNGQTPTAASTKYTSAGIKVSSTVTIKAIAVAKGDSPSPVASATYTIK